MGTSPKEKIGKKAASAGMRTCDESACDRGRLVKGVVYGEKDSSHWTQLIDVINDQLKLDKGGNPGWTVCMGSTDDDSVKTQSQLARGTCVVHRSEPPKTPYQDVMDEQTEWVSNCSCVKADGTFELVQKLRFPSWTRC